MGKENPKSPEHAGFGPHSHPSNAAQQILNKMAGNLEHVFDWLATPQTLPQATGVHDSQRGPSKKGSLEREQNSPREQKHCWLFFLCALNLDIFLYTHDTSGAPLSTTPGKVMVESLVVIPQGLPPAASSTKLLRLEYL